MVTVPVGLPDAFRAKQPPCSAETSAGWGHPVLTSHCCFEETAQVGCSGAPEIPGTQEMDSVLKANLN